MIIEPPPSRAGQSGRRPAAAGVILGAAAALLAWFVGVAAALPLLDPAEVIVFGPDLPAVVGSADGALLGIGRGYVMARSDRAGFTGRLYREGALFVWPALTEGCFSTGRFSR